MHGHGQAYGRWKGPRSPGSRMRRAGDPALTQTAPGMEPGSGAGPGLVPYAGSGCMVWFFYQSMVWGCILEYGMGCILEYGMGLHTRVWYGAAY